MPFMKGLAPVRRTIKYLEAGSLVFKDQIKIMSINYNTAGNNHRGAKDFIFWYLPQVQYKNPNLQIMTLKNMTPTPFIRCFYVPNLLNDCETVIVASSFENPQLCFKASKIREPKGVKKLNSSQEEADTRLILHVLEELKAVNTILVESVDTDVLILLLHFYSEISDMSQSNIYMQLGYETGHEMLIDIDNRSKEDIFDHLVKVVGKTQEVLHKEAIAKEKKDNPANFGTGCERHCICEIPGQIPCPGTCPLPRHMRGKYKYKKNEKID